ASACECERNQEPSVAQVLHVLNGPEIQAKLCHEGGRMARLVETVPEDGRLIEELYLTFFSRLPTVQEKTVAREHLGKDRKSRRQRVEDLGWSMLNSLEFIFNH